MIDPWIASTVFLASLILCLCAIKRPELLMSQEHMLRDLKAKQSQHRRPTPRVGGAAVVLALLIGGALHADQLRSDLSLSLLSGLFVFCVGLKEDVSRDVSPKIRLQAAFASATLAIALTGRMVPGFGLMQTDFFFGFTLVALVVTLIWSAGTCNAINLIDGLNGLASGFAFFAAVGLSTIAGFTGDQDIQIVAGLLAVAISGFFILNWPFGRIFMGDAGAYAIGHILAWLGILLMARNPEVSGFSILLVLFWPVGETVFSIIRRRLQRKATDQPDRLHFHHLVVRAIPMIFNRGMRSASDNSIATALIYPAMAIPIYAGVVNWNDPVKSLFYLLLFTLLFVLTYVFSIEYFASQRFRRRKIAKKGRDTHWQTVEEKSNLSGIFIQDSLAVDVRISRSHPEAGWTLHTSATETEPLRWNGHFKTDLDAWQAFLSHAEEFGITTLLGQNRPS